MLDWHKLFSRKNINFLKSFYYLQHNIYMFKKKIQLLSECTMKYCSNTEAKSMLFSGIQSLFILNVVQ